MGDEWYQSLPKDAIHENFLRAVVDVLLRDAVFGGTKRSEPVVRWRDPLHLQELLHLNPTDTPATHGELLRAVEDIISFSVKTGHPFFINQLFSGSVSLSFTVL